LGARVQPEIRQRFKVETLSRDLDKPRLVSYLKLSDPWTVPALSQRVDIYLFAEKILRCGVAALAVRSTDVDIGLAAFYCNDLISKRAYLTHLAVCPEHRGHGVGKALIDYAKAHSSSFGMTSMALEVYSANEDALRFYSACGFQEIKARVASKQTIASVYMVCSLK
jgi:ribosomal protein S18 acetylase RimI-like enzyme